MTVLFLGAGKRLSLFERFLAAGRAEKVDLRLVSVEDSPLVPIKRVAEIVVGPPFRQTAFKQFLLATVNCTGADLVVPNMDAATVALASCRDDLASVGTRAVVSESALCAAMEDKEAADTWFREHGQRVPDRSGFPSVVKRRLGFGSRDQTVVADESELACFLRGREPEDYLVQRLVEGQEYTVDAYVARDSRVLGVLSRKRLAVAEGEVDISETHRHDAIIESVHALLASGGWEGPITLQYIDAIGGPVLLEVNPRFGGGVTHSIECGLDSPRWLIREHLERTVEPYDDWRDGSIMTRCRRDIFL